MFWQLWLLQEKTLNNFELDLFCIYNILYWAITSFSRFILSYFVPVLKVAVYSRGLIPFSRKWYIKNILWTLGVLIAIEVLLFISIFCLLQNWEIFILFKIMKHTICLFWEFRFTTTVFLFIFFYFIYFCSPPESEGIILSEISQREKDRYYVISLIYGIYVCVCIYIYTHIKYNSPPPHK